MDNLKKQMDKFLELYNFTKLKQEEIENLNTPITSVEIKALIRNLASGGGGITGPDNFIAEFYQKFQEELRPILLRLIQKIREEGKLHTHSMKLPLP